MRITANQQTASLKVRKVAKEMQQGTHSSLKFDYVSLGALSSVQAQWACRDLVSLHRYSLFRRLAPWRVCTSYHFRPVSSCAGSRVQKRWGCGSMPFGNCRQEILDFQSPSGELSLPYFVTSSRVQSHPLSPFRWEPRRARSPSRDHPRIQVAVARSLGGVH